MFCFCTYFSLQNSAGLLMGAQNIFALGRSGTLATPLADPHFIFQYKGFQTPLISLL